MIGLKRILLLGLMSIQMLSKLKKVKSKIILAFIFLFLKHLKLLKLMLLILDMEAFLNKKSLEKKTNHCIYFQTLESCTTKLFHS